MDQATHNNIVSFIWGIADDVLRDLFKRGKCPDVILPMCEDITKIGYEISFTRHFYQPRPLRTLEQIRADNFAVEKEAEGLLDELLKGGAK
jgi:hypothetical protein